VQVPLEPALRADPAAAGLGVPAREVWAQELQI
jgi:hypothetical protein